MPKRKRRIVPRQPNVGAILPVIQRMIAIDALVAGDGPIIDQAAEELGVVGRSVRRSLDILRELAGPTVFEIDEAHRPSPSLVRQGCQAIVRGQREDQATTAEIATRLAAPVVSLTQQAFTINMELGVLAGIPADFGKPASRELIPGRNVGDNDPVVIGSFFFRRFVTAVRGLVLGHRRFLKRDFNYGELDT